MSANNWTLGLGTVSSDSSDAGRFMKRISEPWREIMFLSAPSVAGGPRRTVFSTSPAETVSGSAMRYMRERQGNPPWSRPEELEIRIGRNRFNIVIHRGAGGWFDAQMADGSGLSIRPAGLKPPTQKEVRPSLDEMRDGAAAVCEAYRMLSEAVERLHDGHFAADRPALNCFAETALSRTRAMYTFLFHDKAARNYVVARHYIGGLSKQLHVPFRATQRPPEQTITAISNRVMHVTFEGASSKHEYHWTPRILLKVIVDGMETFLELLESRSPEQALWFRATHDYVVSRKAFLVPPVGALEYNMVTTAGGISATHSMWDSDQFHTIGRDYYDRDIPPF